MKKIQTILLFLSLLILSINCQTKKDNVVAKQTIKTEIIPKKDSVNIHLFNINYFSTNDSLRTNDVFISISDIYYDSLPIPFENSRNFELPSNYRERLLKSIKLNENDTLYLYNYEFNKLKKIPINELISTAYLNPYLSDKDERSYQDYMIGFRLEENMSFDNRKYSNTFAYFGNENPFVENQMVRVEWERINAKDLPNQLKTVNIQTQSDIYKFKHNNKTYFLQDLIENEGIKERILTILDEKNNIIFNKKYIKGEGAEFQDVNPKNEYRDYQWTGDLLRNQPSVIFGFLSESFGCESITFLKKNFSNLHINCDNRH